MWQSLAATNRHTGRRVVGSCWPEPPRVERMRLLFAKSAWIGRRGGLAWNGTVEQRHMVGTVGKRNVTWTVEQRPMA